MRRWFGRDVDEERATVEVERPHRRLLLPFFTLVFFFGLVGGIALAAWLGQETELSQGHVPLPPADPPMPAGQMTISKAGVTPALAGRDLEGALATPGESAFAPQRVPPAPAWQRAHDEAKLDRPAIAIVIDDLGEQYRDSRAMAKLPAPLTLSYFPHARNLASLVEAARARGHQIMVHMPMAPGKNLNPGPKPLTGALPASRNVARLKAALQAFPGPTPVAINNHMGSAFTANRHQMGIMLTHLADRGVLFLDSLTAEGSQARSLAGPTGADVIARDVFLDHDRDRQAIDAALAHTERIAAKHGSAIAIGHPYPETRRALAAWLPAVRERGFAVVALSRVAQLRLTGREAQLAAATRTALNGG